MPAMPPPIAPALTPTRSLVARFDSRGGVAVTRRVLQPDGTYAETTLGQIAKIPAPLSFAFNVDGAPGAASAGLVVDSDGDWSGSWDEATATVLGGQVFAMGNGPVGAKTGFKANITPSRTLNGVFSNGGANSNITIHGVNRTTTSTIPAGVPTKFLSLWLPDGAKGSVTFAGWPGAANGVQSFPSDP